MYSNLAPRLGQTSFTTFSVGSVELRGGKINWGSLGSSISNAFKSAGRFISNAASRFGRSQAYQDIKRGIHDSGLIRNAAGLAGETLNSLVDIGRLKVDTELQKLRNKVLNSIPADQLAQILYNYQQTHDKITVPEEEAIPLPPPQESRKRPLIEEVVDENPAIAPEERDLPALPSTAPVPYIPFKRGRIRGTGESEWQKQLNNMLGQGVRYTTSKHCY